MATAEEKKTGGRTCKTCTSDRLDWINQQLRLGRSDEWVSRQLKSMGINIGKSSINRHKLTCLEGIPDRSHSEDVNPTPIRIDTKAVIEAARAQVGNDAHLASAMLRDVAQDLLAIVKHGVGLYATGDGPSPAEDIRMLKDVQAILREEAIIAHIDMRADDAPLQKANAIVMAVSQGNLSPSNAERLLNVLHKQLEVLEYTELAAEVDSLKSEVERT